MKDDAPNNQHKHDTVFKLAMREMRVAREMIVRHINPEALKNLDLNTLSICHSSYIDKDLKHSHADILYKAKTKDRSNAYIFPLGASIHL